MTSSTKDWLMMLNSSKCKVMHLGKNNSKIGYEIKDVSTGERKLIEKTECEKDQLILIRSDLKWGDQVRYAALKANRVLGMLKKNFMCRDSNLWKNLYISLVRPHLEYAVQVWNPYLTKDIKLIEKVQRRAIRIPTNMEAHREDYEGRLKEWGLTKLSVRRVRGDLIQMYKIKN
jgi:ribonuclease P/MRP protein subunit RPP40